MSTGFIQPTEPAADGRSRHPAAVSGASIGEYLIRRLQDYGVRHVFGIPGDYVLAFYAMLEKSPLGLVGCTREDCAGFAADAYARLNGIGAVCVTYCVGGLSLCNSIAGAYAEKSPVVVISGSPGIRERLDNPLLHHRVKDFRTQADVFRHICCAEAELNDPHTALAEIDRVLAAVVRYRQPGYIELPRDLVAVVPEGPHIAHRRRRRPAIPSRFARRWARRRGGSPRPSGRSSSPAWKSTASACKCPLLEFAAEGRHPHRGHDAGQERDQRAASAVRRHLRGGVGPRGSHAVRRGERLRDPVGRVHDRHQHGHLHRPSRSRAIASTPPAKRCASATTTTTACCWAISSRRWPPPV